jgi:uncharacterized membrane protein
MNDTLDRWIQRITLVAVLAVAGVLLSVGVALYASEPEAHGPDTVSVAP